MQSVPFVRVLGSSDWCPAPGCDSSNYTISDRILLDTGWYGVPTMINAGLDPLRMPLQCFTHMHADHCMALPQLLLYWRVHNHGNLSGLTLAGPAETLRQTYLRAFAYAFRDAPDAAPEFGEPCLMELSGGESFEYAGYRVDTIASRHAVPGLCYRFTHLESGGVVGFSGDTAYRPEYAGFFQGCDILFFEASFGAGPIDPPEWNAVRKHSSALEAVQVAREACVKRLVLTHSAEQKREGAVAQARSMLQIPVDWAEPMRVFAF